jgi:two-component sensor histidine kinase
MLKEIHHRIKNNMTTVSSLLTFHENSFGDQKSKEILYDASTRMQSMMVLYNKLYLSKNQNYVELSDYILSLLMELKNIFPIFDSIEIVSNIEELSLTPKFLNPLGIILNELITNSIKYVFQKENGGKINIFGKKNNDTLVLTYSDNGAGYPEGLTFENSTGFGLQLIHLLIQQLAGSIEIRREENNSLVHIEFVISKATE